MLGFAGLIGAGRSETMECLFGLHRPDAGEILLDGKPLAAGNVMDAIGAGFGMVPEDRKQEGIFPVQSIRMNTTVEVMDQFLRGGGYKLDKELELTRRYWTTCSKRSTRAWNSP